MVSTLRGCQAMPSRLVKSGVGVAAVLLLAAPAAMAHGGQYKGPGGGIPTDPRAPGRSAGTPTSWDRWWAVHRERYLNLRERLRSRDKPRTSSTGSSVGLTAGGDPGNALVPETVDPRALLETEVLPVVLKALEDADSEVRSAAAVALGKMGFPRSLPALHRARLQDKHRDVRDGALLAVGMLRDPLSTEEVRGVLFDPAEDQRTRGFAALSLGFMGGADAGAALLAFLEPNADALRVGGLGRTAQIEASAIVGLGLAHPAGAAEVLRKDYASGTRFDESVRAFIATSLARLGDRASIPLLLQGLEHDREVMRQSAAIALGVLGKPEDAALVQALVKAALADRDANTRQFAIMGLARIGGDAARKALRSFLDKAQRIDFPFVALALGVVKDAESAPALRKGFAEEKHPDVRGGFAIALGLLGDKAAAPAIRAVALASGDSNFRANCLTALGLMEDLESAGPVRRLLDEEADPGLRLAAALCLGLLRDRATVPALEKLAKEGNTAYARGNACRLLGAVGDAESTGILVGFVRDLKENSIVRTYATAALGTLADASDIPLLCDVGMDTNYAVAVDPLGEISSLL